MKSRLSPLVVGLWIATGLGWTVEVGAAPPVHAKLAQGAQRLNASAEHVELRGRQVAQRIKGTSRYRRVRTWVVDKAHALGRTRAGRAGIAAAKAVGYAVHALSAEGTLVLDWSSVHIKPHLPRRLAAAAGVLRRYNPLSVFEFVGQKVKQDPVFLTGYGVFSSLFTNLQTPALLAAGFGAGATVAIRLLTSTPIDLGVIFWRQHQLHKRSNPDATLGGTLQMLRKEYRQVAARGRRRDRRWIREQSKHHSLLRAIATPLMTPDRAPLPGE